ncbi:MAG: hypothetical protein ACOYI6_03290 [Christensenellales bacterium]
MKKTSRIISFHRCYNGRNKAKEAQMDTRILVVEDDPAILDIIQTGLSVAG